MRYEVRLPQLSMGMSDAEIIDWYVEDGETVPEGADLVEIEAEKARQVLTAPVAGVVRDLQGDQGDVVDVRELLCVIETSGLSGVSQFREAAARAGARLPDTAKRGCGCDAGVR